MNKKRGDVIWIGLFAGIVAPLATSYLIYKFRFPGDEIFSEFLIGLAMADSLGKLLSLSVLPNLLLFFAALWGERLILARGVLLATVFYTLVSVAFFLFE